MPKEISEEITILSLASSEKEASVAVTVDDDVISSVRFNDWLSQFPDDQQLGRSSALVSMIKEAMDAASISGDSLDAIALTNGPGRFTGLRVSVVTARMLCYAWNVPVVAVNALEVAAHKLMLQRELGEGAKVWALTDAQRRQVFAAQYTVGENKALVTTVPQSLFERNEILNQLKSHDHVTGTGAQAFQELIQQQIETDFVDPRTAECDSIGVAKLALKRARAKDFDDILKVEPIYFRPSAAEEVRLAKNTSNS